MRQRVGSRGEDLAAAELTRRGYSILQRNYRCTAGEIDIVAYDGDVLAFVEVRTRRSDAFGTPEESVTRTKIRHLIECAETYLQEQLIEASWRIDVVAIELSLDGVVKRLEVIQNAAGG